MDKSTQIPMPPAGSLAHWLYPGGPVGIVFPDGAFKVYRWEQVFAEDYLGTRRAAKMRDFRRKVRAHRGS